MSLRRILNTRALVGRLHPAQPNRLGCIASTPRPSLVQTSCYATARRSNNTRPQQPPRPFHIPPLPVALISVGLICLSVGLYEYLNSDIQTFPAPIRQALRKALYYEQNKDATLALKYFNEALQLALASDELEKNGAPLTGIMIQLGALQERLGRLPEARQTLIAAIRHLLSLENTKDLEAVFTNADLSTLSSVEQKKTINIAQKLGDITAAMRKDDEAEKWYVWSVEHLLKSSSKPKSAYGDSPEVIFDVEHMPNWLTKTDIGASLEALGQFYSSRKRPE